MEKTSKTETVEEYLKRGGKVTIVQIEKPPKKITVNKARKKQDTSVYDYGNMSYPTNMEF